MEEGMINTYYGSPDGSIYYFDENGEIVIAGTYDIEETY